MSSFLKKNIQVSPQPKQAWMVILGFVLFLGLCLLIGAGRILILAFPVGAFSVGVFLYQRTPILYVGYTWWIWFLTPLIRRLIDYQSGYITPGPLVFTALLVTLISLLTFLRHLPKSLKEGSLPFILCIGSVIYGTAIGLIQNPIKDALMVTVPLQWLCPILFGFHLFINWRDYPQLSKTIAKVFLWGTLVMGIYGIFQFLFAPNWDNFWLIMSEKGARGIPEPLGIRVWSTMDAPQAFAGAMMAGLLLLLCESNSPLYFPTTGFGYIAFLLSKARAGWLSWLVGIFIFMPSLKSSYQMRIIISICLAVIIILPLANLDPFAPVITSRVETLTNAEDDGSLKARQEGYRELLGLAMSETVGKGIGTPIDTGNLRYSLSDGSILPLLFSLGWLGTIPYIGGLLILLGKLVRGLANRVDPFMSAGFAITMGQVAVIGFNRTLQSSLAMVLWGFLGISLAGVKYYKYQRNLAN